MAQPMMTQNVLRNQKRKVKIGSVGSLCKSTVAGQLRAKVTDVAHKAAAV